MSFSKAEAPSEVIPPWKRFGEVSERTSFNDFDDQSTANSLAASSKSWERWVLGSGKLVGLSGLVIFFSCSPDDHIIKTETCFG